MTTTDPIWQQGAGVRGYLISGAEAALRLLLPPRMSNDDPTTWAEVARKTGYPAPIEASTSWTRLTELDGRGAEPALVVEHPDGRPSDPLLNELVNALILVTGPRSRWHYKENSDRAGMRVELISPEHGPPAAEMYGPVNIDGSLAAISERWHVHGFHGRAWDDATTVGLAAESHADSIIVSGPARLASIMVNTDLEVFRLPLSAINPMTTN